MSGAHNEGLISGSALWISLGAGSNFESFSLAGFSLGLFGVISSLPRAFLIVDLGLGG